MLKKSIAAILSLALIMGHSVAAGAVERSASPVEEAEGAISNTLVIALFLAAAAGIIVAIESDEDDAPVSP